MKLKELLHSCQNQWINLFEKNKNFTIYIFQNNYNEKLKFNVWKLYEDRMYILYMKDEEVLSWEFKDNTLIIQIKESIYRYKKNRN